MLSHWLLSSLSDLPSLHLCLSHSLPLLVTICLSLSLTLSPSLSCPGRARTGAWGDRQAGRLLLVFRPHWQQAQPGCRSGILQPPGPATTSLSSQHILSRAGSSGGGRAGGMSLPGSSYRTARPGSPAPHQRCPLMPPLLALGLDLLEWGPPPASPRLRNPARAKASVWSSLSPSSPLARAPP